VTYKKRNLHGGMCGGMRELMTAHDCFDAVFPHFMKKCVRERHVDEDQIQVPFFYTLFSRPSLAMAATLEVRLDARACYSFA
jgi:hypothetical protein